MNPRSIGIAQLLFAAVAWGTSLSVTKAALAVIDVFHLTSLRYGFATLVFVLMLWRIEGRAALRASQRSGSILVLGIVGIVGGNLLMVAGLDRTRAEHAAVIVAAQPLMTIAVAWVLHRQRPARRTLAAIVLAFFGVVMVVTRGDPRSVVADGTIVGDLMIVGAALCWVTYTLGARAFPVWSALRYTTLTVAMGAAIVLGLNVLAAGTGLVFVPTVSQVSSVGWELFYITIVSALLGTLSWNSGIRRVGGDGFLFINFVPVTAFTIGIVQGYRFNWAEMLGAAVVIGALLANRLPSGALPPKTIG